MRFWLTAIPCLISIFAVAQQDMLILQKNGRHIHTYAAGQELKIETIYQQDFQGVLTAIRNDSIFINDIPFHYKEIAVIHRLRLWSGDLLFGMALMVTGAGILALGSVNGLIREDNINNWYNTSSLFIAGVLIVAGYFLRKAYFIKYPIGKKFKLLYIPLSSELHGPRLF